MRFPSAPRLRRWLFAGLLPLQATALCAAAPTEVQARSVAGFDEVVLAVPAELRIEQGAREELTLEAEPKVLRMITTEQRERRLVIGLAAGRVETQEPIRMKLGVRSLRVFESRGSGQASIGPLRSDALSLALTGGGSIRIERLAGKSLDVHITGAGEITLDGGQVAVQRVSIGGIGDYAAPTLASERAEVTINGSGNARLSVASTLAVNISGVGNVRYHGNPAVTREIRGVGTVEKE